MEVPENSSAIMGHKQSSHQTEVDVFCGPVFWLSLLS